MIDREKVIKWLNNEISDTVVTKRTNPWRDIHYRVPVDTLKAFAELLKDQSEIVRCNDCKWRGTYQCPIYVGGDGMCGRPDEWFCADGERRESRNE